MLKTAVLISGTGRSLKNLIDLADADQLPIQINCVVSSRPQAGGLEFANAAKIDTHVVRRRDFDSGNAHRDAIFDLCRAAGAELVVMAGYLQHLLIPDDFANRVINIHPSLIPNFCGKGFYGDRVHRAVLDSGTDTTGCTVHFVDDHYDHGPIILQREVPVFAGDDVPTLAARVFAAELTALPAAIRQIAGNLGKLPRATP